MTEAGGRRTRDYSCGAVRFALPYEFKLTDHEERIERPLLNIPGETTLGQFWHWADSDGARIILECWSDRPPHPGQPLEIAYRWTVTHAGLVMQLAREDTGFAPLIHAWFELPGRGHFHLIAVGVDDESFTRVVNSIDLEQE